MKLGFFTDYSTAISAFAQEVGFGSLELSAWPQSALNADTISDTRIAEILADLERRGLEISSLGYYPNYLDSNDDAAAEASRYFRRVLELAARMNVSTVSTFAGQTPGKSVEDCLPAFAECFTGFCEYAERLGVRIAIENCPMLDHKTRQGRNIAYSPEIWDAMFETVPSASLGLELDPSHLVFLDIDYVQAVLDYGERIFHVHAKDTEINNERRARMGTFGQAIGNVEGLGNGWWRYRTPGWGQIDWARLISALVEVGYPGNLDIEHEDEVFAAGAMAALGGAAIVETLGRERNGLILGHRYLSLLIPPGDGTDLLPH